MWTLPMFAPNSARYKPPTGSITGNAKGSRRSQEELWILSFPRFLVDTCMLHPRISSPVAVLRVTFGPGIPVLHFGVPWERSDA